MGTRFTPARLRGAGLLLALALLASAAIITAGRLTCCNQQKILTNEDRLNYLTALGWNAQETPAAEQTVELPAEFPPVLEEYNALQLQQGFDLREYRGKTVELYTYKILNYPAAPEQGDVYGCLYIHKGKVIGGDIHSASITGFMEGLRR